MPRAEIGSTKHIANKMKSKGLQRLRWYCQVCEKQCRDENGFKCHTMSESHVRNMQTVGQNAKQFIDDYSSQFLKDFLTLLRTGHGTKQVHANHFYNTYIANKEHIHMNATKWKSLGELVKYLGREGICRVEETEKGLHIAWIDNSPEALQRQAAVQAKERQARGDEEREQRQLQRQIEKAQQKAVERKEETTTTAPSVHEAGETQQKISINFGKKAESTTKPDTPPQSDSGAQDESQQQKSGSSPSQTVTPPAEETAAAKPVEAPAAAPAKIAFGMGASTKPKNVFAQHSKKKANPLAAHGASLKDPPKKMSEAERIMREEMERTKRKNGGMAAPSSEAPQKRQRLGL